MIKFLQVMRAWTRIELYQQRMSLFFNVACSNIRNIQVSAAALIIMHAVRGRKLRLGPRGRCRHQVRQERNTLAKQAEI